MRQIFLPAIGPYVTDPSKKWRHPIHWLDNDTPDQRKVYYPHALASYALWRDSKLPNQTAYYWGDSGGYTQVTNPDYSASPTDVIRWQIKNCAVGCMFDLPPYRPGSAIQFRGSASQWWDESLGLSISNVKRSLPIYLTHKTGGNKFKWWGVIQGEEWDQMKEWHGKISEVYPFTEPGEGWALAPKPSTDLLSCTRYLRFAHEHGIKRVHFLQVTADKTVALVLALAQLAGDFELITYDSASALRCAINRSAIIPKGFGQQYIKEETAAGETTVMDYMRNDCPCQACQWVREDWPLTNSETPHYILLHNHLIMVESFRLTFEECQRDPERVIRWAAKASYGAVMNEWERTTSGSKLQRRPVSLIDRIV